MMNLYFKQSVQPTSFFTPLSKKSFFSLLFFCIAFWGNVSATTGFITRWDLSKAGATATELSFGVQTAGIVNYTWQQVNGAASGMGTFSGTTATISGLPTNAVVDVTIAPTNFQRININNGTDKARLMEIKQWGTTAWTSMENAFWGCANMTLTATDVPNLTGVTSMRYMFAYCSSFNQPLPEGFNTENVTIMRSVFEGCIIYNQTLPNSFNTAKVQDMDQMFSQCRAYNKAFPNSFVTTEVRRMASMFVSCTNFNQPLTFNTAKATTTAAMFVNCTNYNQPLPNSFNTANVTDMFAMFQNCTKYNQPFPSSFSIAKVTFMRSMFAGASAFNQSLASWGNQFNPNVELGNFLDNCGMSVPNYDATLTAFNAGGIKGRNMGATGRRYCVARAARANLVLDTISGGRGWTITGDIGDTATVTSDMTWTGAYSTDWNNACNWSPSGIPTVTNQVIINDVANDPIILSGTTAVAKEMYINRGVLLKVNSGGILNINVTTVPASITFQGPNSSLTNDGTINVGNGSGFGFRIFDTATIINRGTINTNSTIGIVPHPASNVTFTNESTGIVNGDFRNGGTFILTNRGTINYLGGNLAISFNSTSTLVNEGTIKLIGSINNPANGLITNNACGKIFLNSGTYTNGGTTTNAGLIQITNSLNNTGGTFTNTGVLKYGTLTSTVTSNQNSSIIVNNTQPIFTYGGTYNGTINGIFTDSLATVSAGTFTAPNDFRPLQTLPVGSQTLYVKITPSGGACSYVVPFTYVYTKRVATKEFDNGTALYQNRPNPFSKVTIVSFDLTETDKAVLTVFDVNGRQVFTSNKDFKIGYNELTLDKSIFQTSGTYFYRLTTDKAATVKRLQFIGE